jgi:hypothetical protein
MTFFLCGACLDRDSKNKNTSLNTRGRGILFACRYNERCSGVEG